jgi:hypothetical protein
LSVIQQSVNVVLLSFGLSNLLLEIQQILGGPLLLLLYEKHFLFQHYALGQSQSPILHSLSVQLRQVAEKVVLVGELGLLHNPVHNHFGWHVISLENFVCRIENAYHIDQPIRVRWSQDDQIGSSEHCIRLGRLGRNMLVVDVLLNCRVEHVS